MFTSVRTTQNALRNKKISVSDVVSHFLTKINEKNKDLNVFLTLNEDESYELAKKYDGLLKENPDQIFEKYPLLGCIVSFKDLYLTKGLRTTAGSKVLDSFIPPYSAKVVDKIKKAGAIIIGKTNCDAWAHGASGENSDFGPTLNPWNKAYVPGGSSSGSAVSVAAGLNHLSFGTDTGGSIRQPANFCGIYGLKPTYGSVSRYGVIAMASSLDTVGHFGNNISDIENVFKISSGVDLCDATLKDEDKKQKDNITVGIPKQYFEKGVDQVVSDKVHEAIKIFEKNNYKFKEVNLPNTKHAISVYYIIQPAEVSSNLGRYDGIRFGNSRNSFGTEAKRRIILGNFVLSSGYYDAYYKKATQVRTLIINELDKAFDEVDLLIAPVSPSQPFKLGEKVNDPLKMYLSDVLTVPANIAGIPGLSVPFGMHNGLPLGFQLMGPRFSEKLIFKAARDFESFTNYKFEPPKF